MTEKTIKSENARLFFKDISDRNNQMLGCMHQYNNYTIVLLAAIWTIVSKYVIDDPTSLTVVVIALNISIAVILLWRFLIHQIDNDLAKNYSRLVFYEHALTGFQSTPDEQSLFHNLTKNFPKWNTISAGHNWDDQYRAFNFLCKKNKLGERGHQHLDKIAVWVIGFLLIIDLILYIILIWKYDYFTITLFPGTPVIGFFFICLWLLKTVFLTFVILHLFTKCKQLDPNEEDVKNAFSNPMGGEMIETAKNHGLLVAWILTIIGIVLWPVGIITGIKFFEDIGIPVFFGGAAFVVASKTLIYQDKCDADFKQELKKKLNSIEEKIDKIPKNEE